jgi:hypothetical protein
MLPENFQMQKLVTKLEFSLSKQDPYILATKKI